MRYSLQSLLIAMGLFLSGTAYALPVSECELVTAEEQICNLWESDKFGNPSSISSPAVSAFAPVFGADWAPRWVAVYNDKNKKWPKDVVLVTKSDPPLSHGLFADMAILYSHEGRHFHLILKEALAAPLCKADNSDTTICLLEIVEDANGVATFQQPFVFSSTDPNSPVEAFDTIFVHSGLRAPKKNSDSDKKDKNHYDNDREDKKDKKHHDKDDHD